MHVPMSAIVKRILCTCLQHGGRYAPWAAASKFDGEFSAGLDPPLRNWTPYKVASFDSADIGLRWSGGGDTGEKRAKNAENGGPPPSVGGVWHLQQRAEFGLVWFFG